MPRQSFADLNLILPRSSAKTSLTSRMPLLVKDTVRAMWASGIATVALARVAYGIPAKDFRCDFDPRKFQAEVEASGPSSSVAGCPPKAPISILSRLTVVAETPEDLIKETSFDVLSSFDLVAVQPTSQQTFQLACERSEVDLIVLDCTNKLPFHLSPKLVQLARKRGLRFELAYAPSLKTPSSRRHLFAAARSLGQLVSGSTIVISSGATEAIHTRGPHDVSNLANLLGLTKQPHECNAGTPGKVVERARIRVMRNSGVSVAAHASELEGEGEVDGKEPSSNEKKTAKRKRE